MPIRRVLLGFSEGTDIVVRGCAFGALSFLTVNFIETILMEGVFAKEVYCRQIETSAAGSTSSRLENCRLVTQIIHFLSLGFCLASIAFDEAPVLAAVSICTELIFCRIHIRNLLSFPLNDFAKILLYHAHCGDCVRA